MRQSLRLDFSIIENFESMQTINNKRKYKLQQLFKMLSLSLDTWLGSFSPLLWALSTMVSWNLEVSPDLNHSRFQFRSRIGFLYTRCCMVLFLPRKPRSWHSTYIKLFKRTQSAIKCRCILWKKLFITTWSRNVDKQYVSWLFWSNLI